MNDLEELADLIMSHRFVVTSPPSRQVVVGWAQDFTINFFHPLSISRYHYFVDNFKGIASRYKGYF